MALLFSVHSVLPTIDQQTGTNTSVQKNKKNFLSEKKYTVFMVIGSVLVAGIGCGIWYQLFHKPTTSGATKTDIQASLSDDYLLLTAPEVIKLNIVEHLKVSEFKVVQEGPNILISVPYYYHNVYDVLVQHNEEINNIIVTCDPTIEHFHIYMEERISGVDSRRHSM